MSVRFTCRLTAPATPLPHVWEHTVGSCHAPLALRADWQAHLRRCHAELGFRRVRFPASCATTSARTSATAGG